MIKRAAEPAGRITSQVSKKRETWGTRRPTGLRLLGRLPSLRRSKSRLTEHSVRLGSTLEEARPLRIANSPLSQHI